MYREYPLPYMIVLKDVVIARFNREVERDEYLSFLSGRYKFPSVEYKAVNEEDLV